MFKQRWYASVVLNLNFGMGAVPIDWRGACILPLYEGKGDKCECSYSRGISLLSVVGKLFGRLLIQRVRAGTESAIGEEQCGFGRVEDAWTQCFLYGRCVKSILQMGKLYSGRLRICNRHMMLSIDMVCGRC